MIIYCDGIFDLFHAGHVTTFKYIKTQYPNYKLAVGVISDIDAQNYKKLPIINEEHRKIMIESCRYVDKVIERPPLILDKKFIDDHQIDIVVHSFYDSLDSDKQKEFFKIPIELGKFKEIPYSHVESTSSIINRAQKY